MSHVLPLEDPEDEPDEDPDDPDDDPEEDDPDEDDDASVDDPSCVDASPELEPLPLLEPLLEPLPLDDASSPTMPELLPDPEPLSELPPSL